MGCGCNSAKAQAATATNSRTTVYEVIQATDQTVLAEFSTLQEARAKAVEVSGRVRVTNK